MKHLEEQLIQKYFYEIDQKITNWMSKYGLTVLRLGLGIIFFWFGFLKFFPGLSPAEDLVKNTIYFVDPDLFIPFLAFWECLIGIGLIFNIYMRTTLLLLFLQMPGTAMPLLILPNIIWTTFPYGLTIEGQYIIKNLVLIGAGFVIGSKIRK